MTSSKSKSPALKGAAGVLVAVLAWIAHQLGWIELGADESGNAADASGGTVAEADVDARAETDAGADSDPGDDGALEIGRLFRAQRSDTQVKGYGEIVKVLPDDNEGSRHQKFIVELSTGQTLLIAHNIDLAPRVPAEEGDRLHFYGEYEYSEPGGVVHWTHHDPKGWHEHGWLEHEGKRYE